MSQIIIQNGNQSKTIEQDDFPIRIGTDLNSEILISGSLAEGLSATIDRIGDKYLLQITNQSIDALMNGIRFKGSHWIESDDELKINNAVIQFAHQGDDLLISVSDISGEQPTIFERKDNPKDYSRIKPLDTLDRLSLWLWFISLFTFSQQKL